MPSSTPNLAIPYPLAADPANVPSDMLALATRIDNLAGSGVFSKAPTRQIFTTVGAGTYTTPAGCRAILVECVGGGGGGGGCTVVSSGQVAVGGSGGGASYSASIIQNPVASYAIQVAAGCAGGAAGNNPGASPAAANDSIFGANLVVAKGGFPGNGNSSTATQQVTQGGSPCQGVTGVGDVRIDGDGGGAGACIAAGLGWDGRGGRSGGPYGAQRNELVSAGASGGQAGIGYGGGGTGGIRVAATGSQLGGAGSNGIIVVTEFY